MAAKQRLSESQVESWCQRARDAGARPSDVAALRAMLSSAEPSAVLLRTIELQLAELANRPRRYCLTGSFFRGGQLYPPRSELVLTPDEVKDIGHVVSTHRAAGRFRVTDPAGVDLNCKHHAPGAELDLDAETADALDDAIEPVVPEPRSRSSVVRAAVEAHAEPQPKHES